MSTKAMRELLRQLSLVKAGPLVTEALAELEALRAACKTTGDCCGIKSPYIRSEAVHKALDLIQAVGRESK